MSSAAEPGLVQINEEFIQRRREQCALYFQVISRILTPLVKEVFPTLDIVGWYTVGDEPKSEDLALHTQASWHLGDASLLTESGRYLLSCRPQCFSPLTHVSLLNRRMSQSRHTRQPWSRETVKKASLDVLSSSHMASRLVKPSV